MKMLKGVALKLEAQFEKRFENFARDPKLLSLAAGALNFAANNRIQLAQIQIELASLKARMRARSRVSARVEAGPL